MKNLKVKEWAAKCLEDQELQYLINDLSFSFLLQVGTFEALWQVHQSSVQVKEDLSIDDVWNFTLVIPEREWESFLLPTPPVFHNTLQAMVAKVPGVRIEGDRLCWAQSIHVIERILFLARAPINSENERENGSISLEAVTGHYVETDVDGEKYMMYYEESGNGKPLIFLHTAGSDSRQYKYLLANKALQKKWHMYAFDLPYHGKSEPPNHWWNKSYRLTTKMYSNWILGFMKATGLYDQSPVIMGSSMGGAIVLHLAFHYGNLFEAAISLEGGFTTGGRQIKWTNHPKVHDGNFLGSWVAGLMSPESPEYLRRLVLWEYAQGGPGVYQGDIYFYSHDWPETSKNIGKAKCPLWVLCGEFDYSCTPEMSEAAAERMGGTFVKMKGIGHFPMSENPEWFLEYLQPILDQFS